MGGREMGTVGFGRKDGNPASTYFDKVWDDHVVADLGDNAWLIHIDRNFLHELSGAVSFKGLDEAGRRVRNPGMTFATIDHVVATDPGRGRTSLIPGGDEFMKGLAEGATRHGIKFFDIGDDRQGIVHVIAPELGVALPGCTFVCGDSHTTTLGGIGALSWGIGSSDGEHVLATQTLVVTKPQKMRVSFNGLTGKGVYAKDLILALIAKLGASAGSGYAIEFGGPAISALSVAGRLTLCNMAIEMSARLGFVPPDDKTFEYLQGRAYSPKGSDWDVACAYWQSLLTDNKAVFDCEHQVDCGVIEPQVTWGTSPEHSVAVTGVVPRVDDAPHASARASRARAIDYMGLAEGDRVDSLKIDGAFIGSCTNARLEDLQLACEVLRGRHVAPGLRAICVPGSMQVKIQAETEGLDEVFRSAGFEWREPGCSLCMSAGGEKFGPQERVISTTNRNFEDRQGPRTRSHLASPATVAASAILGCITDPRPFLTGREDKA